MTLLNALHHVVTAVLSPASKEEIKAAVKLWCTCASNNIKWYDQQCISIFPQKKSNSHLIKATTLIIKKERFRRQSLITSPNYSTVNKPSCFLSIRAQICRHFGRTITQRMLYDYMREVHVVMLRNMLLFRAVFPPYLNLF